MMSLEYCGFIGNPLNGGHLRECVMAPLGPWLLDVAEVWGLNTLHHWFIIHHWWTSSSIPASRLSSRYFSLHLDGFSLCTIYLETESLQYVLQLIFYATFSFSCTMLNLIIFEILGNPIAILKFYYWLRGHFW